MLIKNYICGNGGKMSWKEARMLRNSCRMLMISMMRNYQHESDHFMPNTIEIQKLCLQKIAKGRAWFDAQYFLRGEECHLFD